MSVYTTRKLTRGEAIYKLQSDWKFPSQLTNKELEEELFDKFGREGLESSELANYIVSDD